MRLQAALCVLLLLLGASASAQHAPSPYTRFEGRAVKALSTDEIEGLRAGLGLAMALPAELNRYPGPMHVLEHADALELTPAQIERTRRTMAAMRAEAAGLGEQVIEREATLDALFASGRADAAAVDALSSEIGALRGKLRAAHLRAHLEMRALLNEAQVARYVALRGYEAGPSGRGGHHGRH